MGETIAGMAKRGKERGERGSGSLSDRAAGNDVRGGRNEERNLKRFYSLKGRAQQGEMALIRALH